MPIIPITEIDHTDYSPGRRATLRAEDMPVMQTAKIVTGVANIALTGLGIMQKRIEQNNQIDYMNRLSGALKAYSDRFDQLTNTGTAPGAPADSGSEE